MRDDYVLLCRGIYAVAAAMSFHAAATVSPVRLAKAQRGTAYRIAIAQRVLRELNWTLGGLIELRVGGGMDAGKIKLRVGATGRKLSRFGGTHTRLVLQVPARALPGNPTGADRSWEPETMVDTITNSLIITLPWEGARNG